MAKKNEKQTKKQETKAPEKFAPKGTVGVAEIVAEANRLSGEEITEGQARAIFNAIMNLNAQHMKIQIVGFANFEPRFRNARKGRNPQTGAEIEIASSVFPAMTAGRPYKVLVNEGGQIEPKVKKGKAPKVEEVAVTEEEAPKTSKKDKKDKKKDKKKSKK